MGMSDCWLRRQIVGCIVVLLAVPFGQAATPGPQQSQSGPQAEGIRSVPAQSQQPQPRNSNNATGTTATDSNTPAAVPEGPHPVESVNDNQQSDTSQHDLQQPQNGNSKPLGTAAAPYEKSTGTPASRPAGAVIAPAKQKRARSFLIKVGVIVGAAVAIGTVVALSKGSPSRPN